MQSHFRNIKNKNRLVWPILEEKVTTSGNSDTRENKVENQKANLNFFTTNSLQSYQEVRIFQVTETSYFAEPVFVKDTLQRLVVRIRTHLSLYNDVVVIISKMRFLPKSSGVQSSKATAFDPEKVVYIFLNNSRSLATLC